MKNHWRPIASYIYCAICVFDFIVMPILWNVMQLAAEQELSAWSPISLQENAFIHLSFGAFIGIYAHGRTQEKLNRKEE